jgi:hypothetical protein
MHDKEGIRTPQWSPNAGPTPPKPTGIPMNGPSRDWNPKPYTPPPSIHGG